MIFRLFQEQPMVAVVFLVALVIAISVHEFSHALAGYLLGDRTAKYEGRLTLNPLAHLSLTGSIMMLLVGFGWGRPVPFNPYNLRYRKWGPVLVGLAGPFANMVTFLLAGILYRIFTSLLNITDANLMVFFLFYLGMLNVGLAFFNLIPLPPLDGSKLLEALLPPRYDHIKVVLFQYGPSLLLILLLMDMVFEVPIFYGFSVLTQKILFLLF